MIEINKLSVVIPIFGCFNTIKELLERLNTTLKTIVNDYEIIFVDDSDDIETWDKLKLIGKTSKKVLCIKLSRNFGQHAAITAGLDNAKGDWVVIMDCDLQDRPEEIKKLIENCNVGYDIVFASRKYRNDNLIKKLSSRFFYSLMSWLTNIKLDYTVSNFGLYSKKVIKAVLSLKDNYKFFPLMVRWIGFKFKTISVKHDRRIIGKSNYSLTKLILISFTVIISFSDKLLKIFMFLGFLISGLSTLIALYYLYLTLSNKIVVLGYSSLIISVWFIGGMLLGAVGFVGIYVGKTFDQTKQRPTYIISEKINF